MQREYDMTGATRATEVEHLNRLRSGKTRITIMLAQLSQLTSKNQRFLR